MKFHFKYTCCFIFETFNYSVIVLVENERYKSYNTACLKYSINYNLDAQIVFDAV